MGPVRLYGIVGVAIGWIVAAGGSATAVGVINTDGALLTVLGIAGLATNENLVKGKWGGLASGFALGAGIFSIVIR